MPLATVAHLAVEVVVTAVAVAAVEVDDENTIYEISALFYVSHGLCDGGFVVWCSTKIYFSWFGGNSACGCDETR
jgi:hypothetical protein